MKQNIVEVIAYLLEVATSHPDAAEDYLASDHTVIKQKLEDAGFGKEVVANAFDWLKELIEQQCWYASSSDINTSDMRTMRVFTPDESIRIGIEVRNFILSLEEAGILDTKMREIVINQLMQLNQHKIELLDAKWVVLLVLISRSNKNIEDIRSYLLTATLMEE